MHLDVDRSPVTSFRQVTTTSCAFSFSFFWPPMWSVEGEISSGTRVVRSKSQSADTAMDGVYDSIASCSMRITRITGHSQRKSLFIHGFSMERVLSRPCGKWFDSGRLIRPLCSRFEVDRSGLFPHSGNYLGKMSDSLPWRLMFPKVWKKNNQNAV